MGHLLTMLTAVFTLNKPAWDLDPVGAWNSRGDARRVSYAVFRVERVGEARDVARDLEQQAMITAQQDMAACVSNKAVSLKLLAELSHRAQVGMITAMAQADEATALSEFLKITRASTLAEEVLSEAYSCAHEADALSYEISYRMAMDYECSRNWN